MEAKLFFPLEEDVGGIEGRGGMFISSLEIIVLQVCP